nr:MAG TPA: hypothetical protein [Caudoviricetes sp.]
MNTFNHHLWACNDDLTVKSMFHHYKFFIL